MCPDLYLEDVGSLWYFQNNIDKYWNNYYSVFSNTHVRYRVIFFCISNEENYLGAAYAKISTINLQGCIRHFTFLFILPINLTRETQFCFTSTTEILGTGIYHKRGTIFKRFSDKIHFSTIAGHIFWNMQEVLVFTGLWEDGTCGTTWYLWGGTVPAILFHLTFLWTSRS